MTPVEEKIKLLDEISDLLKKMTDIIEKLKTATDEEAVNLRKEYMTLQLQLLFKDDDKIVKP